MKNKTKLNLKRAILFFIPLCLIAGMLAVPAFADDPQVTNLIGTTWRLDGHQFYGVASDYGVYYIDGRIEIYVDNELVLVPSDFESVAVGYYTSSLAGPAVPTANAVTFGIVSSGDLTYFSANYTEEPVYILLQFTGGNDISDPLFIDFINAHGTLVSSEADGEEPGIFAVWTQITDWIINGLKSATNAFYYNGQLTLLGYLCIIPLALGVALLLISIIQKFLRLRG